MDVLTPKFSEIRANLRLSEMSAQHGHQLRHGTGPVSPRRSLICRTYGYAASLLTVVGRGLKLRHAGRRNNIPSRAKAFR